MKLQGRSLDEIPFKGMLYPYLPILGLAFKRYFSFNSRLVIFQTI